MGHVLLCSRVSVDGNKKTEIRGFFLKDMQCGKTLSLRISQEYEIVVVFIGELKTTKDVTYCFREERYQGPTSGGFPPGSVVSVQIQGSSPSRP